MRAILLGRAYFVPTRFVPVLLVAAALGPSPAAAAPAAASPAAAAPVPLSELPEKPARYAQAKGRIPATITNDQHRYAIERGAGACLIPDPPQYWIDGDTSPGESWTHLITDAGEPWGIERLVERGDTAELERVAVSVRFRAIEPSARSRIPLHAVATLPGLTVYAYRWASKVFIITRSLPGASVRSAGASGFSEGPDCGYVIAQLPVRNGSSQVAQIHGRIPGTGKAYLVDASVSQTGRDPEPLLSVTARLLEK